MLCDGHVTLTGASLQYSVSIAEVALKSRDKLQTSDLIGLPVFLTRQDLQKRIASLLVTFRDTG